MIRLALIAALAPAIYAQPPEPATITFTFDRPGLAIPRFTLTLRTDQTGEYNGTDQPPPERPSDPTPPARNFHRAFTLSAATTKRVFTLAHDLHNFDTTCASPLKNIADTGTKSLKYSDASTNSACAFNFSENKDVQQLVTTFQGIAETMDEGRRLQRLHRFDRLGLDAELEFFHHEVTEAHALELTTIEPDLRAIASDTEVMQRVRTRAATLLGLIPSEMRPANVAAEPKPTPQAQP